jgi:hypothetical protein
MPRVNATSYTPFNPTRPTAEPLNNPYWSSANDSFRQAATNAMPSPQSLDNAAARVRSRLSGSYQGQQRQWSNTMANRGLSNSGKNRMGQMQNWANYQNSIASGLADVEDNYQKALQTGAGIMSQVGQGQTSLANNYATQSLANQGLADQWAKSRGDIVNQAQSTAWDAITKLQEIYGEHGKVLSGTVKNGLMNALAKSLGINIATDTSPGGVGGSGGGPSAGPSSGPIRGGSSSGGSNSSIDTLIGLLTGGGSPSGGSSSSGNGYRV